MIRPTKLSQRYREFANRAEWRKTRKGNLCRNWEGAMVVLFRGCDGGWSWLAIYRDRSKRFADHEHDSRRDAIQDAWEWVG